MKKNEINIKKHKPISKKRLAVYQHLWKHGASIDGMPEEVKKHLARIKAAGGGGIETVGNYNKDYLGAFMAPFSRDLENADVAIIGAPLEKSAPMNASHKYGPAELRRISKNMMGTIAENYDMPFEWCRVIDYGTVDTYGMFELKEEMNHLVEHLMKITARYGITPLVWGGDHSVSYAPIKACADLHGPLGLIHFDAHFDLLTRADFDYPYTSGHQFAKSFAEGSLDPERMITMGIRATMTPLVGGHPDNFGVTWFSADACREMGAKKMAKKVIKTVGGGPVYLSLDLDSLDPAFNASSSAVEPFGLTTWWIYDVMRYVRDSGKVNLVGADVVEYAPQNDLTNRDGYQAAGLSWKLLCWLAAETRRRNGENRPTVWDKGFGSVSL